VSPRRRIVLAFIVSLTVGLAGYWVWYAPRPTVGGGYPDGPVARWAKSRVYAGVSPLDEAGYKRLTPDNAAGWHGVFREPIQSFEYYRSINPTRPTPQRRTIVLQPIGPFNAEQKFLLNELKYYCEVFFQLPARMAPPVALDLTPDGRNQNRTEQYDAGTILERVLMPRLPDDAAAYLGITMEDLTVEGLNYVFGLGSFAERVGVYSLCRYYPQFWGRKPMPKDKPVVLRRACQVLNHEMGHMLGMEHCVLYKCSLNGGNSLADSDGTPLEYCPVCHRKLLWNVGIDGAKRYRELVAFYRSRGLSEEARWTQARLENWNKLSSQE
jgi:archaemetzincin